MLNSTLYKNKETLKKTEGNDDDISREKQSEDIFPVDYDASSSDKCLNLDQTVACKAFLGRKRRNIKA